MIGGAPESEHEARRRAEIREQRRYEIARDVMAALHCDGPNWLKSRYAVDAVRAADGLLAALEAK